MQGARRVTKRIRNAVYGSPVYQLSLMGRAPNELNFVPPDPWPSQSQRAEALFHGNYVFAGEEIRSPAVHRGRPMVSLRIGWPIYTALSGCEI